MAASPIAAADLPAAQILARSPLAHKSFLAVTVPTAASSGRRWRLSGAVMAGKAKRPGSDAWAGPVVVPREQVRARKADRHRLRAEHARLRAEHARWRGDAPEGTKAAAGVIVSDGSTAYDHLEGRQQRGGAPRLRDSHDRPEQHPSDASRHAWAAGRHAVFTQAVAWVAAAAACPRRSRAGCRTPRWARAGSAATRRGSPSWPIRRHDPRRDALGARGAHPPGAPGGQRHRGPAWPRPAGRAAGPAPRPAYPQPRQWPRSELLRSASRISASAISLVSIIGISFRARAGVGSNDLPRHEAACPMVRGRFLGASVHVPSFVPRLESPRSRPTLRLPRTPLSRAGWRGATVRTANPAEQAQCTRR